VAQAQIPTDLYLGGNFSCKQFTPPSGCITDAAILGAAGVQASKLQHQHQQRYAQNSTTTGAADQQVLHVVRGATATILELKVGAITAAVGAATATFDLLKNGTTILTATAVLGSGTANFATISPAGYTSTSLVTGDVLELKVTVAAGGGTIAKGLFALLSLREDAQ
jgi:hypothetical protein